MKILFLSIMVGLVFSLQAQPKLISPLQNTGGRQFSTDLYGLTPNPMGGGSGRFHFGVDIACRVGTPIIAVADGVIIACVKNDQSLGNFIVLRVEGEGDFTYGHLKETWYRRGQRVKQGWILGLTGNTGYSTGPHLHFQETRDTIALFKVYHSEEPFDWRLRK